MVMLWINTAVMWRMNTVVMLKMNTADFDFDFDAEATKFDSSDQAPSPATAFPSTSPTPFDERGVSSHSLLGFPTDSMTMNFGDPGGLGGARQDGQLWRFI